MADHRHDPSKAQLELGPRLKLARRSLLRLGKGRITADHIASHSVPPVMRSTVFRWEAGKMMPRLNHLMQYLNLLEEAGLAAEESQIILGLAYPDVMRSTHRVDSDYPRDQFNFGVPIVDPKLLHAVYKFDEIAYTDKDKSPVDDIPEELFKAWWHAFKTGFLVSYRKKNTSGLEQEPFAVVGMFPVTEEWSNRFIRQEVTEFELHDIYRNPHTKFRIVNPPGRYWYLSGLSSKDVNDTKGVFTHLPNILGHSIATWAMFNADSLPDDFIVVSEGTTQIGETLLNQLFRFKMESPGGRDLKPRFSKKTTLAMVKRFLLEDPFFSKCTDLHRRVKNDPP